MKFWWNAPIALALTAALCYAFVPVLAKKAMVEMHATPTGLLVAYATFAIVWSVLLHVTGLVPISWGANLRALPLSLLIGCLTASAFICMNRGLQIPEAPVSLVLGLIAIAPVLSSLIEVAFLDISIPWYRAIGGCALVVVGSLVLTTGKMHPSKPAPHATFNEQAR